MNRLLKLIRRIQGINSVQSEQNELKKMIRGIEIMQKEILNAHRFSDTIKDSEWLKIQSFSAGGAALDYGALYTMYRILDSIHPKNILEFGLGQSSRMIYQYANHYNDVQAITYEHDEEWICFFKELVKDKYPVNIYNTELQETIYNGHKTLSYKDNCKELLGKKYDFIFVDGPFGSEHYSRSQILHLIPSCLTESFCIMIDDVGRPGEQETITEIERILKDNNIEFYQRTYWSSKEHTLFCSKNLRFLTTDL
ncbi:MAG: hypothetical protein J5651_03490 [Salinivirgaceae bacterium]|nr:hypothetical protein [Salinivirgaceae bacterium]